MSDSFDPSSLDQWFTAEISPQADHALLCTIRRLAAPGCEAVLLRVMTAEGHTIGQSGTHTESGAEAVASLVRALPDPITPGWCRGCHIGGDSRPTSDGAQQSVRLAVLMAVEGDETGAGAGDHQHPIDDRLTSPGDPAADVFTAGPRLVAGELLVTSGDLLAGPSITDAEGRAATGSAMPLSDLISGAFVERLMGLAKVAVAAVEAEEARTRAQQVEHELAIVRSHQAETFARMIADREERLDEQRAYARRLEDEVALRSADLLKALDQAECANRTQTEFLANMSHEIRTPMTAIIGYADLLLDADQKQEERAQCVATIIRNGEYLLRIINDILDISKIQSGKLEIEKISFSPLELVYEVHELLRLRAEQKQLAFEVHIVNSAPRSILSDPVRLRQILINLISNAIKFTEQGEVRVEVISEVLNDGCFAMSFDVVDSGIGIDPQQAERLFQPFVQADTSHTRRFGGTGLGLSISQRLTTMLGGRITVESRPGEGSRFRIGIRAERGDEPGEVTREDSSRSRMMFAGSPAAALGTGRSGIRSALDGDIEGRDHLAELAVAFASHRGSEQARSEDEVLKPQPLGPLYRLPVREGRSNVQDVAEHADIPVLHAPDTPQAEGATGSGGASSVQSPASTGLNEHQPVQPPTAAESDSPEPMPPLAGCLVLLVEDGKDNQRLIRHHLTRAGAEVDVAGDGWEACERLLHLNPENIPYDLIFMDMQMPVMDGYEATRMIRAAGLAIPIVALTAHAMASDRDRCIAAGCNDYATKPINPRTLVELTRKHTDRAAA